jgi:hypothetical protein
MAFIYLSTMVFLPQYAQEVLGYTPTQAGLLIIMRAVPLTLVVPIAGSIAASGKIPLRYIVCAGFVVMAVGNYWQSQVMTPGTDFFMLSAPLMLCGVGNAMCFSPLFLAIIGGVPMTERHKAGAIISVTIQFGGAIATAMLVSTLHVRTVFHQTIISASETLNRGVVVSFIQHMGVDKLYSLVEVQARASSYADVAFMIAVACIITAPAALFLGRPKTA